MLTKVYLAAKWIVLGPILFLIGGLWFAFDQILPRYLLIAVLISPFALVSHFVFGISLKPFFLATVVLGTLLAGFLENCEALSLRSFTRSLVDWIKR